MVGYSDQALENHHREAGPRPVECLYFPGTATLFRRKEVKVKMTCSIFGLFAATLVNTFIPAAQRLRPVIVNLAKIDLIVTWFFIGAGLSAKVVRSVGVLLWGDFDRLALRNTARRVVAATAKGSGEQPCPAQAFT